MAPRKRITSEGDKAERALKRAKLGSLKDLQVAPGTLTRYDKALRFFFAWLTWMQMALPDSHWGVDDVASAYICHLWEEGEPLHFANDCLSGLQFYISFLQTRLKSSWRLARAWSKREMPARAAPVSPMIVVGFIGACVSCGWWDVAALLATGFLGLLRTGELFSLKNGQVEILGHTVFLSMEETKTSARKNAQEMVTFGGEMVMMLLTIAGAGLDPGEPLLRRSAGQTRRILQLVVEMFGLEMFRILWYSLRRGGASWEFKRSGSMDRVLVLGRWEHARTARIYVNDALAASVHVKIPDKSVKLLTQSGREGMVLIRKKYNEIMRSMASPVVAKSEKR